jgi:hypothetical protein
MKVTKHDKYREKEGKKRKHKNTRKTEQFTPLLT